MYQFNNKEFMQTFCTSKCVFIFGAILNLL